MKVQNKFTLFHRVLHWLMALAMPVLFVTGFLRMFWMNKNHIVSVLQEKAGAEVMPKEQMVAIAKTIRDPMWDWHVVFAHVMIFAFIARIIYMIVRGVRFPNPFEKGLSVKDKFQGLTYVYFYIFLSVSAVTGICLRNGFFPAWKEGIERVHKFGLYWFPIFILLHFSGVVIAEYSNKKGIVSKMIGGE